MDEANVWREKKKCVEEGGFFLFMPPPVSSPGRKILSTARQIPRGTIERRVAVQGTS
jgi:hypothetical protein